MSGLDPTIWNPSLVGPPGADGKTIHTVSGAPSSSVGVDYDYAIDPVAWVIYGPKVSGVWPAGVSLIGADGAEGPQGIQGLRGLKGNDGAQGLPGADGATIISGIVDPLSTVGKLGDFYLRLDTLQLWGPKLSTGWGVPVSIKGDKGDKGDTGATGELVPEFRVDSGWVQWKYTIDATWNNLIALADITGPAGADGTNGTNGIDGINGTNGTNGTNGIDGKNVELQNNGTYIQWRLVGDATWINLVALSAITGPVASLVPGTGISIDATDPAHPVISATGGGGGGGGYENTGTKPLLADFTWVNQGSASAANDTKSLKMTLDNGGSLRMLVKPVAAGAFTLTARVTPEFLSNSTGADTVVGLVMHSTSTNKAVLFGIACNVANAKATIAQRWTTPTTFGSNTISAVSVPPSFNWIRIVYNGTSTVSFYASADGYDWTLIGTENVGAGWFLDTWDRIGIGARSANYGYQARIFTFDKT